MKNKKLKKAGERSKGRLDLKKPLLFIQLELNNVLNTINQHKSWNT